VTLEEAVTTQYYVTSVALTPNVIYSFKVTARNAVGESLESQPVLIRAARIPDAPISVANIESITSAYQIGLNWLDGAYDGGSPVIDYTISFA
jgi:hypothetical protein